MTYSRPGIWHFVYSVGGWMYFLALGLGLFLGVIALTGLNNGRELQTHGITVTGQVTDLWISTHSCGKNNRDTCTDYNVGFAFEVFGRMRPDKTTVSAGYYGKLKEGGPIPVRYVKGQPDIFEVEIGDTMLSAVFMALLALGFILPGGYAVWTRVDLGRRMVRLRETGVMRKAKVTAREMTSTKINSVRQWRIRWRDEAGGEGQSRMQRAEELPDVGAEITVYADPEGKLAPVWDGDSGTR